MDAGAFSLKALQIQIFARRGDETGPSIKDGEREKQKLILHR